MLQYTPYLVAILLIALTIWILTRYIIRLIKGKSTCGSCSDDSASTDCSSGCGGCSYARSCNSYNGNHNNDDSENDSQDMNA